MNKFRFDAGTGWLAELSGMVSVPEGRKVARTVRRRRQLGFRQLTALALGVGMLAGCNQEDRILFEGFYFRSKAAPVDKKVTLKEFTVGVWDIGQSLTGAIEAGKYEATRYCIANYGTSRVKWISGPPEDTENLSLNDLTIEDGVLVFHGLCDPQ